MNEPVNSEDLFDFPCHYTFKAVGSGDESFAAGISAAVGRYALFQQDAVNIRPSGKGNYQSISIMVRLENFQQLTDIYAAMKEVPGVKMLL